ncbi:MAG TPA: arylsulfatase [Armatimonadetes bacterium]|jgi:arylsulfatase|nr:arylsulfatase [Armatimonadota bacterium]
MSQTPARPNILLIMTDQHRGDCLGCAGHPALETPYLNQLAAEGTRFRYAYTAVPSCIPARATLMTGMHQWHTGILGMGRSGGNMTPAYRHTLPGELGRAGYHTQGIGKMHFHPQRARYGFDNLILDESSRELSPGFKSDYRQWFEEHKEGAYGYRDHSVDWNSWMSRPTHLPEHLHPTHWTAQQAIEWLGRRDPTQPFFLKVSFARPHSPYDPPQAYYDLYRDRPLPEPYVGEWAHIHAGRPEQHDVNAWRSQRSPEEIRRARACYYGSITFIDHQIGRILYELRRYDREAWQNTLVLFLSDHGDMLGDHCLWRKTYAYEGSAHIPFIVRPPVSWGWPRGQVLDHVVEIRDVMPTLLEAADVPVPETVDGSSLLPLVRGQTETPWREYIQGEHDWCYSHEQANFYVTDGRWKYIWFPYLGTEQLFDLESDPGECHNLAEDATYAQTLAAWRSRLVRELEERDCGLVRNGHLVRLGLDEVVKSPHLYRYGCA